MPITISGDGGIAGVTNLDGGDFECATLVSSGDTTLGPQAVGRASLFVDDSANSVGINTTTPAAAVFLEVADGTNPIVSLNNTGNGEVRLGCTSTAGYIGTESNHPFNIETNSSTKIAVLANGDTGIGTTTPDAKLEVEGNVSNTTQFEGLQGLRLQNGYGAAFGGTVDLNFVVGTGSNNRGACIGAEYVSPGGNALYFATNPNAVTSNDTLIERMRIDANGRVGIGTTSPQARLHVVKSDAAEETPVRFRNFYNDGVNNSKTNLRFEMATANNQGGTAVIQGVCGTDAGGANAQNDGGLRILVSSGGSGTLSEAATFTKLGNLAFPNGQGIDFSATEGTGVNSSILDDYEEGTFTPVVTEGADDGSGGTVPYSVQAGRYTKVGGKVFVDIYIRFATGATSTSTQARIGNLPFNISNLSYGTIGASNLTRGGGTSSFHNTTTDITTVYGSANNNFAFLYKNGGEGFIFGGGNNVNLTGEYWIGYFTYNTDS